MSDKETLIQQFQTYLEELPSQSHQATQQSGHERCTDLYDLFTELVSLRNEVKRESRQVQSAMDTFKSVFNTLEESQGLLRSDLEETKSAQHDERKRLLRPLLLDILSIRDGMTAALEGLANSHPHGWLARLKRSENQRIDQIREGQLIGLRRLDDCLSQQGVHAMRVVGKQLDPHSMRVIEVESTSPASDQNDSPENGQVIAELRAGFTWDGALLRLAEVKVFKSGE